MDNFMQCVSELEQVVSTAKKSVFSGLGTFNDIELGDIIETFEMREVERK